MRATLVVNGLIGFRYWVNQVLAGITISNFKYRPVFIFDCWFQDKIFRLDIYLLSSPCHASGLFLYPLKFSGGIEREQSHEMNHSVTEQLRSCFISIVLMVLVIWWHQVFQGSFKLSEMTVVHFFDFNIIQNKKGRTKRRPPSSEFPKIFQPQASWIRNILWELQLFQLFG